MNARRAAVGRPAKGGAAKDGCDSGTNANVRSTHRSRSMQRTYGEQSRPFTLLVNAETIDLLLNGERRQGLPKMFTILSQAPIREVRSPSRVGGTCTVSPDTPQCPHGRDRTFGFQNCSDHQPIEPSRGTRSRLAQRTRRICIVGYRNRRVTLPYHQSARSRTAAVL